MQPNELTPSSVALAFNDAFADPGWHLIETPVSAQTALEVRDALEAAAVDSTGRPTVTPRDLLETASGVLVVWQIVDWADAEYAALEQMRTMLRDRHPRLVWLATPKQVMALVQRAPNVLSFFLPNVGVWSEGAMSDTQIEAHLQTLRDRYQMSDAHVIELGESGKLPADPAFHTWLTLLMRGDLVRANGR